MPNFDNGSLPWVIDNVRSVRFYRRTDKLFDVAVIERTRLGNIRTEYEKVEAVDMTLDNGTLTIKSISAIDNEDYKS